MKRRMLALSVALSTLLTLAGTGITSADHADPHIGANIGMPEPDSHNSTYSYYIEVCLNVNIGGGPYWQTYGTGYKTQDRIRDAMAAWNALGGEARLFASNQCESADTSILVSYDQYSNFAELQRTQAVSCAFGTCWRKAVLHWNSNKFWHVGTGTPPDGWYDAWSMFTHELGHAFYLGESSYYLATMFPALNDDGEIFMRTLRGGPCDGSGEYSDVLGYKTTFTCNH